jgi:hypothetical protein
MVENRGTTMRSPGHASLIDVLDRVLDKGIVIDAWGLAGIALITVDAKVYVPDWSECLLPDPPPAHSAAVGIWRPQIVTAVGNCLAWRHRSDGNPRRAGIGATPVIGATVDRKKFYSSLPLNSKTSSKPLCHPWQVGQIPRCCH